MKNVNVVILEALEEKVENLMDKMEASVMELKEVNTHMLHQFARRDLAAASDLSGMAYEIEKRINAITDEMLEVEGAIQVVEDRLMEEMKLDLQKQMAEAMPVHDIEDAVAFLFHVLNV